MKTSDDPVLVVGGGWAGLATAITLAKAGRSVAVYESAKQAGGRARCTPFGNDKVDNGQHLMIGAYHEMQKLMTTIGLEIEALFNRFPVELKLIDSKGSSTTLKAGNLPSPLNLLAGFFISKGISLSEHAAILKLLLKVRLFNDKHAPDVSVSQFLSGQPASLCYKLWNPLCIAAMNTPPDEASANIFIRVLRASFLHHRHDSDLLIPKNDLGATFPQPAASFIEQHGGQVHIGKRVTELLISNNRIQGVVADGESIDANQVVMATAHHHASKLFTRHEGLAAISTKLDSIETQPICTVYLKYSTRARLDFPMTGLLDTTSQWVFDRRICGQPGMMAVVISADGPHMQLEKDQLAQLVSDELAARYPHWPEPEETLVIREKRATFSAVVGIDQHRPPNRTPVQGLWLAGDYTSTGYPSTLEGAVHSGVQSAKEILNQQEHSHV